MLPRPEDTTEVAIDSESASMLGRRPLDARRAPRGPLALVAGCLALAAAAAGAARVVARRGGTKGPTPPRSLRVAGPGCEDLPGAQSGATWSDGTNGCEAYEGDSSFCSMYGDADLNGDGTANDRCCACGGGQAVAAAPGAGGVGCEDLPGKQSGAAWSDGTNGCEAYEGDSTFCGLYGASDFNDEGAAQDHCCACGGGKTTAAAPKPAPKARATGSAAASNLAPKVKARSSAPGSSRPMASTTSSSSTSDDAPVAGQTLKSPSGPFSVGPDTPGDCSIYAKESANCDGEYMGKCGACFNAGARGGVICPGEKTGYQCPPDEPDVPGGMAFACMDWTFGSTAMLAAEASFNGRSGEDPVYFGVGTYGVSYEKDKMGGLGMCVRMHIDGVQRDIIAQSINTGHDVAGNQFDLQIGAGGAGAFNTCAGSKSSMFPGPKKAWGHQYGGPDKKKQCKHLPPYPRDSGPMKAAGDNLIELCEYGFDKGVFSNPTILSIDRVACPKELVNLTQFRRTDGPDAEDAPAVVRRARRLAQASGSKHKCNVAPGVGLDWCQTRMMDCRKPSGAVKDNVVEEFVAPGLKLVQPCTADGYTRIDVQCGCYDCYC